MNIKKLRERAMYSPQSLTKAEWDILCEEAFHVPKDISKNKSDETTIGKQQKKWW